MPDNLVQDNEILSYHDGFAKHNHVKSVLIKGGSMVLRPLVSIMIPTYRRPYLLKEAIESALKQDTELPFEVVVVDNESDLAMAKQVDDIVQSFNSPNLILYRNETNIGMFGNWNRCITLAKAEWLTILSDDDLLKPNFLSMVWNARNGNAFIAANVEHFGDEIGRAKSDSLLKRVMRRMRNWGRYSNGKRRIMLSDVLLGNPVMASIGVLFNKQIAVDLGGYNDDQWPTSDYVFNVRYWLKSGGEVIVNCLARYRWGENESLKVDTMIGFINNDYLLRKQLINAMTLSENKKRFFHWISLLQKKYQCDFYLSRFEILDRASEFYDRCGINQKQFIYPTWFMTGFKLAIWFGWITVNTNIKINKK